MELPAPLLDYARELLARVACECEAKLTAARGSPVHLHVSLDALLGELQTLLSCESLAQTASPDAVQASGEQPSAAEAAARRRRRTDSSLPARFRTAVRQLASLMRGDWELADSLLFSATLPLAAALALSRAERSRGDKCRAVIGQHHTALRLRVVSRQPEAEEETRRAAWAAAVAEQDALESYADAAAQTGRRAFVRDAQNCCARMARDFLHGGGAARAACKAARREHFTARGEALPEPDVALVLARTEAAVRASLPSLPALLDVGSCNDMWRPLEREFAVTALDLQPAAPSVWRADFLRLRIGAAGSAVECEAGSLLSLPAASFHILVLSLVLSYIPDPAHRAEVVWRARRLLRDEAGLLLIVTPNSSFGLSPSQASACVPPIQQEWRRSIEAMSFERFAIEKQRTATILAFRCVGECPLEPPPLAPLRIAYDEKRDRQLL